MPDIKFAKCMSVVLPSGLIVSCWSELVLKEHYKILNHKSNMLFQLEVNTWPNRKPYVIFVAQIFHKMP